MQEIWEPIKDWPSFINEKMPAKYNEWLQPEELNYGIHQQNDLMRQWRMPGSSQNGPYQNTMDLRNSRRSFYQ
jgi:hypothetical protein